MKFFTSYRILRYIERRVKLKLLEVAGQKLTREFIEKEVDEPLRHMLQEEVKKGSLINFDLFIDKSEEKRMMGICDIKLSVMPTGLLETVNLEIEVPPFEPEGKQ